MPVKRRIHSGVTAAAVVVLALIADNGLNDGFLTKTFVSEASARVGRPLTPASAAGVARRTTNRVVRRSTIYVNTLPAACAKVVINGVTTWKCSGTYYQLYGTRYVVVYVQ